ncbi:MAG: DUF6103 family protein [Hydrogenoanaerobacterium sp.]
MKTESIAVQMESDKLRATRKYMEKKDASLEQELSRELQKLYEKYVPAPVREYIDEAAEDSKSKAKPNKPRVADQPNRESTI